MGQGSEIGRASVKRDGGSSNDTVARAQKKTFFSLDIERKEKKPNVFNTP